MTAFSHKSVPAILRSALGLQKGTNHTVAVNSVDSKSYYVVYNGNKTAYLLCYVIDDNVSEVDDKALMDALASFDTVAVVVVFRQDGAVLRLIRKNFRTGDFDYIAQLDAAPTAAPKGKVVETRSLRPLKHGLEDVLFEVHSALRDIDGLHAPDALDEICKLIYAKLFDEESGGPSHKYKFERASTCSTEESAAEIRQLYLSAVENDRAIFSNKIAGYDRSRGVFRDPLMLSSAAIIRAVEILQRYDLTNSPVDIKGRAFQNVLIPAVRAGMGQYFTPKEVIDFITMIIRPDVRELVLDPFCGSGHFLTSALDFVRGKHRKLDKAFHEFAFTRLHGIEKSDRMVRIAMTDMRLHGDGHSNIRCVDTLLPFGNYPDLVAESFDVIMTNPPFGVDLQPEATAQLGPFELAGGRRAAVSLEILALERCIQLLRPGGRMAIVLPDGILSNRGTSYVRKWLAQRSRIKGVFSLPVEAFTPFGANIKTSILVVRKHCAGEGEADKYPVFLAEISSIGYDSSGRPIAQNELPTVAREFCDFIDAEGW